MCKNLYAKVVAIVLVVVLCGAVGVHPLVSGRLGLHGPQWLLDKQVKFGLDLQRGVNLEMRVETDAALKVVTDLESERLRETLMKRAVTFTAVTTSSVTQFRVDGVPSTQEATFREAANDVQANFDRSPAANGAYTFTMKPVMSHCSAEGP